LDVLADCKLLTGSIEEVIPIEEQAIRLNPRDPAIGWWYLRIGQVHQLQSRNDEAIPWLEKARSALPELPFVHLLLASAYGLKGDIERGAAELAKGLFRGISGGGAEDPCLVRCDIYRWTAQSGDGGKVTDNPCASWSHTP